MKIEKNNEKDEFIKLKKVEIDEFTKLK